MEYDVPIEDVIDYSVNVPCGIVGQVTLDSFNWKAPFEEGTCIIEVEWTSEDSLGNR